MAETEIIERDVFFEMPLKRWGMFDSHALQQSKVVLLNDLSAVVDMFNADGVGIGARTATDVISELKLSEKDRTRLVSLLTTHSFDVYSVRAAMNELLTDDELAQIVIPEAERKRLEVYMTNYSRGLLSVILEGTDITVTDRSSLATLLEGKTREKVLKNLVGIARKLGIEPDQIVVYIAKLSEIILAISYYHRVYDMMADQLRDLLLEIRRMQDDKALCQRFQGLREDAQEVLEAGRDTLNGLNAYFNNFKKVERFFDEITPEKFKELRDQVESHFRSIGMILCFWQIKVDDWNKRFVDSRGRRKDSTNEQRYNFFKETVHHNIHLIRQDLDEVLSADLPL